MRLKSESAHRSKVVLALLFIAAGINHFRAPEPYLAIMPPALPWQLPLIYLSGVAEIAGGVGVLWHRTRAFAGWGLMLLLIAVFPANVYAVQNGMVLFGAPVSPWLLWLRLPLQAVLIWWVYRVCIVRSKAVPN